MKIRNGFVSNSSSSSFIINGKISDVANSMLKTVIEDYSDWGNEKATKKDLAEYEKWASNLKKALKNEDVLSGKIGITMPSCNYETYILQVDDQIHVSTARNHEWDTDSMGNVMSEGGGFDEGKDDIVYKTLKNADYFNVKNTLIHSQEKCTKNDLSCPHCKVGYVFYVKCEGKTLCSHCYEEIKLK